ncbi:hypothetical protein MLC35_00695 [Sulfurimonas sp. NW7]|uniref:hypothetical protein n=1 Tax=Sulfurimonas sp. NW7 TaxID=2922727 RepID=UPI003DA80031
MDDFDSHVFYVTSQGYAGDHWYSWFCKSLNAHPEMFVYIANEGSRPKYFDERSRSERPDLLKFTKFISDVGRTYEATGDCYSYRAHKMQPLVKEYGDKVRWVNLVRHPYVWLFFYTRWRATNMRMGSGKTKPLEHEWNIVEHELYKNLRPYTKDDVHIWAFYRGLTFLNHHMMKDLSIETKHIKLEDIIASKDSFQEVVSYLTHDRVAFDEELLDRVYSWRYEPFRGEEKVYVNADNEKESYEDWQLEAIDKIVSQEAQERFRELGYAL